MDRVVVQVKVRGVVLAASQIDLAEAQRTLDAGSVTTYFAHPASPLLAEPRSYEVDVPGPGGSLLHTER